MFARYLNELFDSISIERLGPGSYECSGKKLAGGQFEYENGSGEANLYKLESGETAIQIRLSDPEDQIHLLIKFKSEEKAKDFFKLFEGNAQKIKSHLKPFLSD